MDNKKKFLQRVYNLPSIRSGPKVFALPMIFKLT
jgi:hypothetical protein